MVPKLNVDSIKKQIRKEFGLNKGSHLVRNMMVLAHCRFMDVLKYMARKYQRILIIVDESYTYTSKTCGNCGILHPKLGSNKVYKCEYCKMRFDRDFNRARNILIKNLG